MRTLFRILVFVTMIGLAGGLWSQGRGEDAPETPETVTPEPAEDSSGTSDADQGHSGDSTEGLIPMDDETAEVLLKMGIYPFQDRIPSENFVLENLDGVEVQLADHYGDVVFLNFWATWCGPCREEMPSMQILYDELHDEGLEILAVDVLEGNDLVASFVEELQLSYPILLDRDGRVMLRYGIRAYPTTYIVDRAGYVLGVRPGYQDWAADEVVTAFRTLLSQ